MTRSVLLLLAALMMAVGTTSAYAINDRNNEPACSQLGSVDPRCF